MQPETFDLSSTLSLLRRQLGLIGVTLGLALGLAVAFLALVPPIYTATALVMVDTGKRSLLYADEPAPSAASENARVESEVEILRAPTTALAVVRDEKLVVDPEFGPRLGLSDKLRLALGLAPADSPGGEALANVVLDRLSDAVTIRRRGLTNLIAVSVAAKSPERAASLANTLTAVYIDAQVASKVAGALAARDKLQGQIATAEMALTASETAIDGYIENNLARIEAEGGRTDLAALRSRIQALEAERRTAEAQAGAARLALEEEDWAGLTARLGDAALASLQRQRVDLERRLGGVAPDTPEAVDLTAALAALEADQARRAAAALDGIAGTAVALSGAEREARAELRGVLADGALPSEVLIGLYQLQQEAGIARGQYQMLLSRIRELEMQAAVQIADSRVVSPALAPIEPSFPKPAMVLVLALVAGLGLGIGLAVLTEYHLGGITSESQLRDVLRARVATAVPQMPRRQEGGASVADTVVLAPLSPYAEAIRRLRAALELSLRQGPERAGSAMGQTIIVTSALPGEGKSTTALALARGFALAQRRVLLIDADLRKPSIHALIGLVPDRGLIDYLLDPSENDLTATLMAQDPLTGAAVIPGRGRAQRETDQLLGSDVFVALIQAAREVFDIVIVDAPPVLAAVDTRYLVPHGDAVAMTVRFASTGQGDLRSAVQTLAEVMAPGAELLTALSHQPQGRDAARYADYADPAEI